MTEKEFLQLKIDMVLSYKFDKPLKYYVIYDDDQLGSSYKGKQFSVYGAKQLDGNHYIRIDSSNYQFFNIEGKMK